MSDKAGNRPFNIAIVAGEMSGDILGAGLIKSLKKRYPNANFVGIGGPRMLEQEFDSWFPMETLSVMGLFEVIKHLPELLKVRSQLVKRLLALKPDVFIGIDAPDFNLGVEAKLKAQGIKTVHYVSPTVWAWRPKRIFKIDKATDVVLSLLPFEKAFYDKHQVACEFVGHPLADDVPLDSSQLAARKKLGLAENALVLGVLPGSRGGEMERLLPTFVETVTRLRQKLPNLVCAMPLANEARQAQFQQFIEQSPGAKGLFVTFDGQSREVMAASDAILLASGTAALEAMLVNRPMVVAYKVSAMTYWLAKRLVKVNYVSLPNLLTDAPLVPELLQDDATPEALADTLHKQLSQDCSQLTETFRAQHLTLRQNASERAADVVQNLLENGC
ncbi:lipid-A-disaccharide synthase [Corallincola platygyrae]|uniref:Lipid-A-disaccharide synthase n=1 Tax=Corallincola platygyrae TaxID=1193278 RepID=A0ABW4XQF2_9GAMM